MTRPDAIIFDMDGTLWDATQSYAQIWNETFAQMGIPSRLSGQELHIHMGSSLDEIIHQVITAQGIHIDLNEFLRRLTLNEARLMPRLGGTLYDGVRSGLETLAKDYPLLLLSNCSASGLRNFMHFTGTHHLFSDALTHGERPVPKSENLLFLAQKHRFTAPVYMGDTQADCDATHQAGFTFAFARYGFGSCHDSDFAVDSFTEFVKLLSPDRFAQSN
ncbi:MAG: HAD family hydrolase [Muribaculaceae bacterium]|nr:HAD family hydrolase [Muribaculaceae bacterium]